MDAEAMGRRIRARRRALGITQEDLASLAGCSPTFVRCVEQGKATLRLDKLTALLDVLWLKLVVTERGGGEGAR